jgi:hypothetical protein
MQNKLSILFTIIILALGLNKLEAQDNTLYLLHQLPQANMLNPALNYPCNYYIEIPLLSSFKFAYNNSSFTYKDFIRQGEGAQQDSLIMDFENIYGKLKKNNYLHTELENVILGAGFHWKDYFVSFRISHTMHAAFRYTKDLIGLKDGNWDPSTDSPINFHLTNNELNEISYWKFSVAASKYVNPYLRLGARLSYLKGSTNYHTKRSELDIITTEQPVSVSVATDYEVNASFPMEYERNPDGTISNIQPVFDNFLSDFLFNSNRGLSVDFGGVYEYNEKITLSASITGVGFIWWASNSVNLHADGEITYIGEDLDQYTQNNQSQDILQILQDTISSSFRFNDTQKSYITMLPMTAFAGGSYQLNPKIKLGVTGKLFYFNGTTMPSLTGSINFDATSFLNLSASVSYANRSIRNVGFATIIGNRSFNFYFVTDMLPINYVSETQSGMLFPYNSRSFNFRFGFNLGFGCGKSKSGNSSVGKICPAYR